jgi:hypothetical protein
LIRGRREYWGWDGGKISSIERERGGEEEEMVYVEGREERKKRVTDE